MEGSLPQTLSLSSVLMLDFILGIWMIRGTLKYIYIILIPGRKVFIQGLRGSSVCDACTWAGISLGKGPSWLSASFWTQKLLRAWSWTVEEPSSVSVTQGCACCWGSQELHTWIMTLSQDLIHPQQQVYKYHQCTTRDLKDLCKTTEGEAAAETYLDVTLIRWGLHHPDFQFSALGRCLFSWKPHTTFLPTIFNS